MSEPLIAIALYRAHEGKENELTEILKSHISTLDKENLITSLEPIRAKSSNCTVIEIFEWKSEQAKDAAHESAAVMEIWNAMMQIADMKSLSSLDESNHPFPNFVPFSLD